MTRSIHKSAIFNLMLRKGYKISPVKAISLELLVPCSVTNGCRFLELLHVDPRWPKGASVTCKSQIRLQSRQQIIYFSEFIGGKKKRRGGCQRKSNGKIVISLPHLLKRPFSMEIPKAISLSSFLNMAEDKTEHVVMAEWWYRRAIHCEFFICLNWTEEMWWYGGKY